VEPFAFLAFDIFAGSGGMTKRPIPARVGNLPARRTISFLNKSFSSRMFRCSGARPSHGEPTRATARCRSAN
jgi:hypothetical protein